MVLLEVSLVWGVLVVRVRRWVGVVLAVTSFATGLAFAPAGAAPPPPPEIPSPVGTVDGKVVQEGPTSERVPTELPEGWVPREVPPLTSSGAEVLPALEVDRSIAPLVGVSGDAPPEPVDGDAVLAAERAKVDAARRVMGFDPEFSKEVRAERAEFASVFDNVDGTSTAVVTLEPQHFRDAAGEWAKIDARLVPVAGRPGVWETAAGAVRVRVDRSGLEVTTAKGRSITFGPAGVGRELPAPEVADDGLSVTYAEVWPGVDLRFRVSAATVTKELVVKRPGTASSFGTVRLFV